jgi:hypothetical protein
VTIAQPGARETTHVGAGSEVRIPFLIFVLSSVVADVMTLAAYVILAMPWIKFGGWRSFRTFWAEWWPGLVVPLMAWWILFGYILLHYRYIPEQRNRNWPPLYAVADVREVGFLDVDSGNKPLLDAQPETVIERRVVEAHYTSEDGRQKRFGEIPDAPGLPAFATATANGQSFSVRTAARFHIGRPAFEEIRAVYLERGWAMWKNSVKRQGLELTHAGRAVMRHIGTLSPTLTETGKRVQGSGGAHAHTTHA